MTLQGAKSRLLGDLASFLADLVPDGGHAHDVRGSTTRASRDSRSTPNRALDDNADSHLRATLLGPSVTVTPSI